MVILFAFVALSSLGWRNLLEYHAARRGDACVPDDAVEGSKHWSRRPAGHPPASSFQPPTSKFYPQHARKQKSPQLLFYQRHKFFYPQQHEGGLGLDITATSNF